MVVAVSVRRKLVPRVNRDNAITILFLGFPTELGSAQEFVVAF